MPLPLLPIAFGVHVLVQLPASASPEAWARVLRSCDSVLGANECARAPSPTLADAPADAATPSAAELWWEADTLHVRFRVVRDGSSQSVERSLSFENTDPENERWVAAGLMIAALAASVQNDTPSPASDTPAPAQSTPPASDTRPSAVAAPPPDVVTRDVPPRDEPSPPRKARPPLNFDLGASLAPGVSRGVWRFGPLLRASWLMFGDYGLTIDVRNAYSADVVALQWYSAALGPTWRIGNSSRLGLDAHVAAVVEWTVASATRADAVDTARSARFGGRAALSAWFGLSEHLSAWLSVDASHLTPNLEVHVGGVAVAKEQGPNFGASTGLRFELDL